MIVTGQTFGTLSFHVCTPSATRAVEATEAVHEILDHVWICGDPSVTPTAAPDVFLAQILFQAPRHEAHKDAPVLRHALRLGERVAPIDAVRVRLQD